MASITIIVLSLLTITTILNHFIVWAMITIAMIVALLELGKAGE